MRARRLSPFLLIAAALTPAGAQRTPPRARSAAAVTFHSQIVRILQQHCQSCHRPGEIAPFPLLTYADARANAARIKAAVQQRRMPPWKPVPGHGEFLDENRLREDQIDLIARWVDAGAPEGDPRDAPAPLRFADEWTLGEPDLVLEPDQDFMVPAAGGDVYRCFSIPTRLLADSWVAGLEVRPGNRRVVHHVLVFPDPLGLSALQRDDAGPGYGCFGGPGIPVTSALGGWAPGVRPRLFPDGVGVRIPASSRVVVQVHYHPSGAAETDRTRIGLYLARGRELRGLVYVPLVNTGFVIPPGAERYPVTASLVIPPIPGLKAVLIAPHMHLLGREIRVDATYPDGSRRPLIYIDDWDFDWQGIYYYREPVPLPPGTRLDLAAVYDNSAGNARNPYNPPREVRWGEQSTDEMCLTFIGVILD